MSSSRFGRHAVLGRTTLLGVLVVAGLAPAVNAEAASGVRCGDRITRSVTLTKDLHCKKDALKIGAHGISLDLGGHDIVGPGRPGTTGIENPGYDRVAIDGYGGGTVRGFDRGIVLRKDARKNEIVGMRVHAGRYGLVQFDSCTDRPRDGNGVDGVLVDNSHRNHIGEFNFVEADARLEVPVGLTPSQGTGLLLRNSDNNHIVGNAFAGNANDGIFIDSKSTANRVGGNLAVDNGKLGINVRGAVIDGGDNHAFGNGWKAQCRGIPCAGEYASR